MGSRENRGYGGTGRGGMEIALTRVDLGYPSDIFSSPFPSGGAELEVEKI